MCLLEHGKLWRILSADPFLFFLAEKFWLNLSQIDRNWRTLKSSYVYVFDRSVLSWRAVLNFGQEHGLTKFQTEYESIILHISAFVGCYATVGLMVS